MANPPSSSDSSCDRAPDRRLIVAAMDDARGLAEHQSSLGRNPPAQPRFATPASDSFPGYELTREIHRGGQGVVYQALQYSTHRKVAIKVMRDAPFASPRDKARFEREVQILSQLKHPGIVAVHDSGNVGPWSYHVMDYIAGQPLDVYIASRGLGIKPILRLFKTICEAVNVAHLRGIIHRDIKPSNIRVDPAGEPRILDFGLAKVSEFDVLADQSPQAMTITGQFVGSLPWASPEQAEGHSTQIDIRTDVYSIGVTLYQMLTDRFPYEVVGNMRDVMDHIVNAPPLRPSLLNEKIDDEVQTIVLKCLAKERERRYQSAGELARDIGHYLSGEPIDAKSDSGWYVARKLLARHRGPVVAAGAFLVLLAASAVALAVLYQRADTQAALAQERQREAESLAEVAQRERIEAQRQAAIALAVNDFLNNDLLTAVDPIQGSGRETTVREVLDRSAAKIGDRFADEKLVEASIRGTIGNAYKGLGKYDLALEQAEQTLSIRRELLGEEHPDTMTAMNNVGELYEKLGRLAEAEPLYVRCLEFSRRTRGEDDRELLGSLNNLGMLNLKLARYAEAERLMREALATAERGRGADDPITLTIAINLGQVLDATDRPNDALSLYQRVLEARRRVIGPDHPDTLTTLNNIAGHYSRQRRWADAEATYRETLAAQQRVLGEEHPYTLATMNNLAMLYWRQERADEAETLWLRTYDLQRKVLGQSHPSALNSLASIALIRKKQKRFDEADAMYHEVLEGQLAALGPDHPAVLITQGSLAMLAMETGRLDDAAAQFEQLVAARTRIFSAEHASTLTDLNNLAAIEVKRGRHGQAETLFKQVIDARQRALGPLHADTITSQQQLGKLYASLDRLNDAEATLALAAESALQSTTLRPEVRRDCLQRLISVYEAMQDEEKAASWRARAAALETPRAGP
jgi:tetratricopeptide (TPR) repeat protein/tRNA A-37 threonylcarbamoyl transferase component Bud32